MHKLLEAGETSRFFDKINYLVDGLRPGKGHSSVRSLRIRQESLLELAELVLQEGHGFSSKIRAHGILVKIVEEVEDLWSDPKVLSCLLALIVQVGQEVRRLQDLVGLSHLITIVKEAMQNDTFYYELLWTRVTPFKDSKQPLRCLHVVIWLISKLAVSQSSIADIKSQLIDAGIDVAVRKYYLDVSVEEVTDSVRK